MTAMMLNHPDEKIIEVGHEAPYSLSPASGERIIWVFPVYSWGVPPVVRKYIKKVEINPETAAESDGSNKRNKHYMVCTCGDDVGLTHKEWRRLIRKRGWRAVATFSVQMPNTYVLLPGFDVDSATVADEKLSKAPARIRAIARAIRHEARVDDVVRGGVPWIKSKILRPLFKTFLMSPKPFHYTDKCVGCGKCASQCPMDNIIMSKDGSYKRPEWGKNCALCLGCYHICPHHAVAYGHATEKKGQYSGPQGVK